ncbi:MAG TPA: hypothetical protein VNJ01_09690 [Bacteriovoracaceae bacterium]|nr:hypothetical protein [Bacteriovoracaceae bacterium]
MIRKYRIPIFLALIFLMGILHLLNKNTTGPSIPSSTPAGVDVKNLMINGKKVVGLTPGNEEDDIQKLKVTNNVSTGWENKLKSSFKLQGGKDLQDISLEKVDSFIWAQEGMALNVESVIVRVRNLKNQETSFRVLVDAQSGKVLKNWDQPVIDPANPREAIGVKVDTRYHSE